MGVDGRTVSMPGQRVRGFPAIKAFAAIERYGFVWVWPGDQDQANPDRMPVFEFWIIRTGPMGAGFITSG